MYNQEDVRWGTGEDEEKGVCYVKEGGRRGGGGNMDM